MIYVYPDFYPSFQCIASACRHTCCKGWEIDIDEDSLSRYRKLKGPLGRKLRGRISSDPAPHFVLDNDERCPFLREDGLCEMILELGEDSLCDICTEHPRFYNEFPDRLETGLGLCCEEVVRLLLEGAAPLCWLELSDESIENTLRIESPEEKQTPELLENTQNAENTVNIGRNQNAVLRENEDVIVTGNCLNETDEPVNTISQRNQIFLILADNSLSLTCRMEKALISVCNSQQQNKRAAGSSISSAEIHTDNLTKESGLSYDIEKTSSAYRKIALQNMPAVAAFYLTLETLDPVWRPMLEQLMAYTGSLEPPEGIQYERLAEYFVYRHFTAAKTQKERELHLQFCFLSTCLIRALEQTTETELREVIRLYSSEIEYSDENVDTVLKYLETKNSKVEHCPRTRRDPAHDTGQKEKI